MQSNWGQPPGSEGRLQALQALRVERQLSRQPDALQSNYGGFMGAGLANGNVGDMASSFGNTGMGGNFQSAPFQARRRRFQL